MTVSCTGSARHKAIGWLAQLYLNIGEHKKANDLAGTAPTITCCREFLQLKACDGKARAAKYSETVLKVLGVAADLISDAVAANKGSINNEDAEAYIRNAAEIFDVVCPDGEYGEYRVWSAHLYLYLSTYQWRNGKHDAAFDSLDKALMHMRKCAEFSNDSEPTFDSPLLKNVKLNPEGRDFASKVSELPSYWPWICIPDYGDVAAEMQADPRWEEWVRKTQE